MYSLTRYSTLLVLTLLGMPTNASAQVCGTFAEATEHVILHRAVFDGAKWATTRTNLRIDVIGPDDPAEIVRDTATCLTLMNEEVLGRGLPGYPDPHSYAIYRYGPYFAIEYRPPPDRGNIRYHASPRLHVYTVEDLELKGSIPVK